MPADFTKLKFVDSTEFRSAKKRVAFDAMPLPTLPPALHYEPGQGRTSSTETYVMTRDEERSRFLQLNWLKRQHNLCGKDPEKAEHFLKQVRHLVEYLVRINMPLVYSQVARNLGRYQRIDWNESVSEAQLGLHRALHCYDVVFGIKFSTYACRAILNSLNGANQKAAKRQSRINCVSIPEASGEGEDVAVAENELADLLESLAHVMETNDADLTDVEDAVIRRRFGLGDAEAQTLEEIGNDIGVSKERIRQIQNKALLKLKKVMAVHA